jgi:Fe-S-cluster-containing hydrogenase component 2
MAKRLILDLDLCCGCRSCEAACKAAFKSESRIKYGRLSDVANLPMACKHCPEPLCQAACPVQAIKKDETSGLVLRSSFICTGCKSCMFACPFGVIDAGLIRHVSQKCSLCGDRVQGPRCVAACSSGALKYLSEDEIKKHEVGIRIVSKDEFFRRRG